MIEWSTGSPSLHVQGARGSAGEASASAGEEEIQVKGSYGTKVGACPCWPLLLLLLLLLLWGGVGVRLPGCLQGTGRRKSTFRQGNG
jgi:hypothetical protein